MLYNFRFLSLQNAVCLIILTCLFPVLFTFYIHGVLKLKKNNSGAKRLNQLIWRETCTAASVYLAEVILILFIAYCAYIAT